jgi:hypothetical protein
VDPNEYFRICVERLFGTLLPENLRVHANDYVNGMELPFDEFCFVYIDNKGFCYRKDNLNNEQEDPEKVNRLSSRSERYEE